jgi:predicted nucleic acid-binding protein
MFEGRILPVTEYVMLKWRLLVEEGRRTRYTYAQPDLIVAATALHHGLTIVTRDTRDFARSGASIHNPWN